MERVLWGFLIAILWLVCGQTVFAKDYANKRVFILHSYDDQFPWTHFVQEAAKSILDNSHVQSMAFYMDTKRHSSEAEKFAAAQMAKLQIEQFKPDVVITSDDDAVKYVLMPYYKNSEIPFVFCGVNWDASVYGLPYKNATGMLEVDLIHEIIKNLQEYTKGTRLGYLSMDGLGERKTAASYAQRLGTALNKTYFVTNFNDWKESFLKAQQEVDMLFLTNSHGIKNFDAQQAQSFVEANIKIPVGATLPLATPLSLLGIVLRPEEHGTWAAQTALKILGGQSPSDIPITRNREGTLFINLRIAEKLGVTFKYSLLKVAKILR
jgi:ABC-type uncharacterized transport system substrate-binding protein